MADTFNVNSNNKETKAKKQGSNTDFLDTKFGKGLTKFGSSLANNLGQATGLGGPISRLQGILGKGGKSAPKSTPRIQFFGITGDRYDGDPRVKIKIPEEYLKGPAAHLKLTGDNAVVFPYTPQIVVQTRANYNAMNPTHSNYTYYAYQYSALDAISIVGTFSAQNVSDADYVMASIHALRSVTKMSFGASTTPGAPPPVCLLDGYGTYQFNNMPVVISSFFYTLNEDVDYLTSVGAEKSAVPTRTEFTIECLPAFSRRDQAEFTIDKFIEGDMTRDKGMI